MRFIPDQLVDLLRSSHVSLVSLGSGGIELWSPEQLHRAQDGYGGETWSPAWIVVARNLGTDDPFFVDTSAPEFPVLTALHGRGEWNPTVVCASLSDFLLALVHLQELSRRRTSPAELSENPFRTAELTEFHRRLTRNTLSNHDWWIEFVDGIL
jgi:hypothetical protein